MQALGILPASFTTGDLTATITRGEMSELAVVAFEKATGNVIDELERTDYFTETTLAGAAELLRLADEAKKGI